MDIRYKLFPHQKALLTSTENMIYLRAGRGSGKSYIASLMAVIALLQGKRVICLGQNFKAVSEVLMQECVNRLYEILKPDEFQVHKGMMKITYKKGTIYFASYETPDAIRGYTEISLAILDEAALADPEIMTILPFCMRGKGIVPKLVMISTPRGQNWLTRFVKENNVPLITATTKDNKFITEEQIALMRKSCVSESAWRREYFGEECEDVDNGTIFTSDMFEDAPKEGSTFTIGCDPAGFGRDFNCIVLRKGNSIEKYHKVQLATAKDLYAVIKAWIHEYGKQHLSAINIDAAYGASLYEVLMDSDYAGFTNLVSFGGGADEPSYANKRAEMYMKAKQFITEHGISGVDESAVNEFLSTKYILNNRDKIQLIPKEDIKQAIGRSPDTADSIVLTFFTTDMPRGLGLERRERQSFYMD